ncbi:hypothetical protein TraAM80_09614, partial [Trypanosoma rangeli]
MAGRVLLVCALCVLCCAGGGAGAWGGGYCTDSDWRGLRAVAKDMTEAEIEGKYCSRKPEFAQGLRVIPQAVGGEGLSTGTGASGPSSGEGDNFHTEEGLQRTGNQNLSSDASGSSRL